MNWKLTSTRVELAGHRYLELDSLRGVAALVVVIHHVQLVLLAEGHLPGRWFYLLPGSAAVVIFFVLSGFVLTPPWLKHPEYTAYLSKRFCRLYLPYAAGLLVAVLASMTVHRMPTGVDWFDQTWRPNPTGTPRCLMIHLSGIGSFDPTRYNTAFWTLVVEMRISLIFPLIVYVVRRVSAAAAVLVSAVGLAALSLVTLHTPHRWSNDSVAAVFEFLVGSALLYNFQAISTEWLKLARPLRLFAACMSLAELALCRSDVLLSLKISVYIIDWFSSLSAAIVILFAVNSCKLRHMLHAKVLLYLGSRSYSFYLVHGTVIFWIAHRVGRHPALILLLSMILLMPITEAFHRAIEIPTMRLGRRVGDYLVSRRLAFRSLQSSKFNRENV